MTRPARATHLIDMWAGPRHRMGAAAGEHLGQWWFIGDASFQTDLDICRERGRKGEVGFIVVSYLEESPPRVVRHDFVPDPAPKTLKTRRRT